MHITIINGPNLNLLGKRQQGIYGKQSMEEYIPELKEKYKTHQIDYFQSNDEAALIDTIHSAADRSAGIVLNPGGLTHQSVSLCDAIRAIDIPVIEVHISHIMARESFRRKTLVSSACNGMISGLGIDSYRLAVETLLLRSGEI